MVNTPSAAAAAVDLEKKRKQSVDRARASHLSRQLQMRLQYARLKVDHGWRQTLNEVENLYFHHSTNRGPKTLPGAPSVMSGLGPNSVDPTSPGRPVQSSLSFSWKPASSNLSRMSTLEDILMGDSTQPSGPNPMRSQASVPDLSSLTAPSSFDNSKSPPLASQTLHSRPSSVNSRPSQPHLPTPPAQPEPKILADVPPPRSTSPVAPWPSPPPTKFVRLPSASSNAKSMPPQTDSFRGYQPNSSSSSLTYDSFWSSHSNTAAHYRPTNGLQPAASMPNLSSGHAQSGANKESVRVHQGSLMVEA
ncbi:hypothetical protein HGRIS_014647 [Hohenbuehelia grisea]|uniref:BZIP domain-containing protein n=1 Tax=Hohenbuehelia grisea TaxID=104357 RepID=A0ABR3JW99_9AGAR